jgi:ParB/RepB/Spo0J family partition protein
MDLEHHQLLLRYEHLRVRCVERERRLLASLAEHGQQIPIVVVASAEGFVVVDGYKRVRAMQRLGWDTVQAACWDMTEIEALLLGRLMRAGVEETAFEQGLWLQELHLRFALSLEQLACRFDRSASWVSRRLALVRDLPETVQRRVLAGEIVAHAAMKHLVPLARANREACERLSDAITGKKLSSRQVGELVVAYRAGGAKTRALVLADPLLVLEARASAKPSLSTESSSAAEQLLRDFGLLAAVMRRAFKRLCDGAVLGLAPAELEDMAVAFEGARREMDRLTRQVQREINDAGSGAAHDDPGAPSPRPGHPSDRPDDGPRARDGADSDPFGLERGAAAGARGESRAAPAADPGALRHMQGESGARA